MQLRIAVAAYSTYLAARQRAADAPQPRLRDDEGAVNVEYLVLAGVLAIGAITAVLMFRDSIINAFRDSGKQVDRYSPKK